MRRIVILGILCILISTMLSAQIKPNLRGLKYAFNRADAGNEVVNNKIIYICLYGGTKSGWNAKTKDYYPVEDKIVYSKIYRLTDIPVPEHFDLSNLNSTIYGSLQKQYMQHLITQYAFNEEINYCTFVADFDLKFVEKKLQERMDSQLYNAPKVKFVYDTKFGFSYTDKFYKFSYKPE